MRDMYPLKKGINQPKVLLQGDQAFLQKTLQVGAIRVPGKNKLEEGLSEPNFRDYDPSLTLLSVSFLSTELLPLTFIPP
jgi:hypothetical protein